MERGLFTVKAVFNKEIFKAGEAVKIEGTDWDGDKVNFNGLIVKNEGEILNIVTKDKLDFDLFIDHTIGSPEFRKPQELEDGEDFGFTITILEESKTAQADPKKKGGYKLSEDDIKNIRKLQSRYSVPQAEIARIFGVVPSTISEIVNFVTHKDIK
jgi:hypothetical protein